MSFLLIVIAMVGGSRCFDIISSRSDRASTLEIPASHLEKFLTWLIITLPILIIVSLCCFYLADIMRVLWINAFTEYGEFAKVIPFSNLLALSTDITSDSNDVFDIVFIYANVLILNSIFTLGSSLFSRLSFIKTLFFLFIITLLLTITAFIGFTTFFHGAKTHATFDLSVYNYASSVIYLTFSIIISSFLYYISFMRLKESEIITRW
ncbi:MAG: hypothetical protein K2J15_02330 [Muribaculaceae bacterium]|nr:hypothetical protein [Muribaculaceae bacterium]